MHILNLTIFLYIKKIYITISAAWMSSQAALSGFIYF